MDRKNKINSTDTIKNTLSQLTGLAAVLALAISLVACDGAEVPAEDPTATPDPDEKTMLIMGARLYDNWMKVKIAEGATTLPDTSIDNPLWSTRAPNASNILAGEETWRCATCHGWDYEGKDGNYGPGNADFYTDFPGLMFTSENIFDGHIMDNAINVITNGVVNQDAAGTPFHAFGEWLTEQDILALTLFIEMGIIETRLYIAEYDPANGYQRAIGNVVNGADLFGTPGTPICANCHHDGTNIAPGKITIGSLSRDDPFQALHKIRFGAAPTNTELLPETDPKKGWGVMSGMIADDYSMHDVNNVLSYIQTLQ